MPALSKTMRGIVRLVRQYLAEYSLLVFLFLLPWQTRYIFRWGTLAGGAWEYGTLGVYATELLFIVAGVLNWRRVIQSVLKHRTMWLVAGLVLGYIGISISWSPDGWLALRAWTILLEAGFIFVLLKEAKSIRNCLFAFVYGVLVQALVGFAQVLIQWSPPFSWFGMAEHDPFVLGASVVMVRGERFLRAYGGLPHPNILGGYLVVALGCVVWLRAYSERRFSRLGLIVIAAVLNLVLFFTFSRAAWVAVFVMFGGAFYLAWWGDIKEHFSMPWRREIWALCGVFFITFLMGSILFPEAWHNRVSGTTSLETRSREERITGMRDALVVIREHPIIGVGIGNYTNVLASRFPGRPSWLYQPTHNVPLLMVSELGLVGIGLVFCFVWFFYRCLSRKNHPFFVFLAPALVVIAMLDHYLWSLSPGVFLMAVALGFSRPTLYFTSE